MKRSIEPFLIYINLLYLNNFLKIELKIDIKHLELLMKKIKKKGHIMYTQYSAHWFQSTTARIGVARVSYR